MFLFFISGFFSFFALFVEQTLLMRYLTPVLLDSVMIIVVFRCIDTHGARSGGENAKGKLEHFEMLINYKMRLPTGL